MDNGNYNGADGVGLPQTPAGNGAAARISASLPSFRPWLAAAIVFNLVSFPSAILVGQLTGMFAYTRELGLFYGTTVVLPALILFADRLPEVLELIVEIIRAYKCQGQHPHEETSHV